VKVLFTYALDAEKGDIDISGADIAFCCTGIGKVRSALAVYEAIIKEKPDLVINIGSSGSVNHEVGDIILCSRFIDRDLAKVAICGIESELDFYDEISGFAFLKGLSLNNSVSTGDSFVTEHENVGSVTDVIDMEAYGIAQACRMCNMPFLSIKYVTDRIGRNSVKAWSEKLLDACNGLAVYINSIDFGH